MALLENILHIMGLDWLPTAERIRLTYNNYPKHISMFLFSTCLHFPLLDNLYSLQQIAANRNNVPKKILTL